MRHSILEKARDLVERGLEAARRLGAAGAAIHVSQREGQSCSFESGRLKIAGSKQAISIGVDVLLGGRLGTAGGNDLKDLDEIVARAAALAKAGSEAHFAAYPGPGPVHAVKMHSRETLAWTREQMIESCRAIVEALKAYDPELFIEAGASRSESERILATTGGVRHARGATQWSLSAHVQRTEGTDMLFAGDWQSWRDRNEFCNPDRIARRIVEDLRRGERIAPAPRGQTVAYLPPETFAQLLSPIALGVSGRNVAKGDSPLRGRLGEGVLDACLTIVDNPHRDYADGAEQIDGDGVATGVVPVLEGGVLRNFLYDLDSAGMAGAAPTGHRNCQPYRPEVAGGVADSRAMLAEIDEGIYIRGLLGFGQSNVMNGDFSCNVALGYRIEKGEIAGRVKNTMIAGNVYELLSRGVRLSRDRDEMLAMPHAVVTGLNVSAAAGR